MPLTVSLGSFTINYTLLSIRGTVVSEENQEIKYNVMQHTHQALTLSSNRSIFLAMVLQKLD